MHKYFHWNNFCFSVQGTKTNAAESPEYKNTPKGNHRILVGFSKLNDWRILLSIIHY